MEEDSTGVRCQSETEGDSARAGRRSETEERVSTVMSLHSGPAGKSPNSNNQDPGSANIEAEY